MKRLLLASAVWLAFGAGAAPQAVVRAQTKALCDRCGTVQAVKQEQRQGKGGVLGVAGGAVAGGLLGNQVGKGTGKTVATVGGAVAGGVIGNEIQKKVTSRTVWVTTVTMKDGSTRSFEQEVQPGWAAGQVVRVDGSRLTKQ